MSDFFKKLIYGRITADEGEGEAGSAQEDYEQAVEYNKRGNYAGALKLYLLAADQGHAKAQCNLGMLYSQGLGVDKNDSKAVYWFRKAAMQNNVPAQINLAVMYSNGWGIPQNEAEATKWYKRAAEQGHPNGQNNYGLACKMGVGAAQNDSEAVYWFRKAAEQDNHELYESICAAQCNLGMMYFQGRGVAQSDNEALFWFRKAADHGLSEAKEYIEKLEHALKAEAEVESPPEIYTVAIDSDNESDNCPDYLSNVVEMGSKEDHVFARILEDLVKSRSFSAPPGVRRERREVSYRREWLAPVNADGIRVRNESSYCGIVCSGYLHRGRLSICQAGVYRTAAPNRPISRVSR